MEPKRVTFSSPNEGSMPAIKAAFHETGVLHLKKFFSSADISRVRTAIEELIRLQCTHVETLKRLAHDANADWLNEGVLMLAQADRRRVGYVYDAAMKLLSTRSLASHPRALHLVESLLGTNLVSVSNNIIVRIDMPHEDRFLFNHWHQDYPYSMVSRTGCVLWIPLAPISQDMGPVEVLAGSHQCGLLPVDIDRQGFFNIHDEAFLKSCESFRTEVDEGDVIVFDLMSAHKSSPNRGTKPRWTLTFRYCDMRDSKSVQEGWPCFYKQGAHFAAAHPDYVTSDVREKTEAKP